MNFSHNITTVINYCSNDYRFINKCIYEAKKFSRQIIVPVCTKFYDGSKENKELLHLTYIENPNAFFIEYEFDENNLYHPYKNCHKSKKCFRHLWHSTSRYISYFYLHPTTDYVLFLDADEIIEGDNFNKYLIQKSYQKYNALRLGYYMYFKEHTLKAKSMQICGLFAKKEALTPHILFDERERLGSFDSIMGLKKTCALKNDESPFVHHYSFVRNFEEIEKKLTTWGHHQDKNWKDILKNAQIKNGVNDFDIASKKEPFYDLTLEKTDPFFDPMKIKPDFSKLTNHKKNGNLKFPNLIKVNRKDIFEKYIKMEHNLL